MKFAQEWKERMAHIPPGLHKDCIDYKSWKKYTKSMSIPNPPVVIDLLANQLERVNNIFNKYYERCYNKSSCSIFKKAYDKIDVYAFALVNSKCLYKLCKRFDKRMKTSIFMKWYTQHKAYGVNGILGGYKVKHLQLDVFRVTEACPICLDDRPKEVVILECGHTVCTQCVLDMFRMRGKRGLMRNIIASVQQTAGQVPCPVCRFNRAFDNIDTHHMWPNGAAASVFVGALM